jgi:hypothetical protein
MVEKIIDMGLFSKPHGAAQVALHSQVASQRSGGGTVNNADMAIY